MKNANFLCSVCCVALLTACGSVYKASYSMSLNSVKQLIDVKMNAGETVLMHLSGVIDSPGEYTDQNINIKWIAEGSSFAFDLNNKTEHTISVIWDRTVFVDQNGYSNPVVHKGATIADRYRSQKPSIIPSGASLLEIVVPASNIYWSSVSGWSYQESLPTEFKTRKQLLQIAPTYIGTESSMILPIEIEGAVYEYVFVFKVDKVVEEAPLNNNEYFGRD